MRRAVFVLSLFVLVGCGGPDRTATSASAATATVSAVQEATYKEQVTRDNDNLESASLNLAHATTDWSSARLRSRVAALGYNDPILRGLDTMRNANDELSKWADKASPSLANVNAENKRFTGRTDTFLRQYRQSFYADDLNGVLSLMTDYLHDMKQHRAVLTDAGFIQPSG